MTPQQTSLFDAAPVARVRRDDPRSAKRAAAWNREGRASQAARILRHLWVTGGRITADECHRSLTLPGEGVTRGEWSARLGVLVDRGLVEHAGEKPDRDRRGRVRDVLAYRLTRDGFAECARMFGGAA